MNRKRVLFALMLGLTTAATCQAATPLPTDDLVFIHHSCGSNWLSNQLNATLTAKDYIDERNDITYGTDMAPDPGRPDSLAATPGDLTDMRHWVYWFNDYLGRVNTHGCATGENRIIMFKSCYPNSNITQDGVEPGDPFSSTQSLANYRAVYRHPAGAGNTYTAAGQVYHPLEAIFSAHPDTLFIVVTAPPLYATSTTDANAQRARVFNDWLKNDWLTAYNASHPGLHNVAVYDWFDFLANPGSAGANPNRLKDAYVGTPGDSHPNTTANLASTVDFGSGASNFLDQVWAAFVASSLTPSPTRTATPVVSATATATITPTRTATPVVSTTATATITPTRTATPRLTATPAVSPEQEGWGSAASAYPNPGREAVHFRFRMPNPGEAVIRIYNLAGENVALLRAVLPAGPSELIWDCRGVVAGVYLARISAAGEEQKLKVAVTQ